MLIVRIRYFIYRETIGLRLIICVMRIQYIQGPSVYLVSPFTIQLNSSICGFRSYTSQNK